MHLRVYKVADIMTTIRPLELSKAFDLGVLKIPTVYEVLVVFDLALHVLTFNLLAPFLESFAVDFLTI